MANTKEAILASILNIEDALRRRKMEVTFKTISNARYVLKALNSMGVQDHNTDEVTKDVYDWLVAQKYIVSLYDIQKVFKANNKTGGALFALIKETIQEDAI